MKFDVDKVRVLDPFFYMSYRLTSRNVNAQYKCAE